MLRAGGSGGANRSPGVAVGADGARVAVLAHGAPPWPTGCRAVIGGWSVICDSQCQSLSAIFRAIIVVARGVPLNEALGAAGPVGQGGVKICRVHRNWQSEQTAFRR